MTTDLFDRFAPFIQEYIYAAKWERLREIQEAAGRVLFDTDHNLLIASGTASGKTEAAFFPVLSKLYRKPSQTVGVLYIAPQKALINDQFERLRGLLADSGIKATKWHGDTDRGRKQKLLQHPEGVLLITPESTEAMLMRGEQEIRALFSDLRFIIIDELHTFLNADRGVQLSCQLERIQRVTGTIPVRIGLSATLGDSRAAQEWLSRGTGRICEAPCVPLPKRKIRLWVQHFYVKKEPEKEAAAAAEAYYRAVYRATCGKKSIIFSNSKSETESNILNLKKIARQNGTEDVYFVHHGNLSAAVREQAEEALKEADQQAVAGATLTLELGIDLGALERIVQTGCPLSVSSFVQRLGRSGRRGQPAEMQFLFREEPEMEKQEFFRHIHWELLKCIAILRLYTEEQWIEPALPPKLPYGILFHQTMSYLAAAGPAAPRQLAEEMLTLQSFRHILPEDYRILLREMCRQQLLELTEDHQLMIGPAGERLIYNYTFYSVFETPEEYDVLCNAEAIGTVREGFPAGETFALAGRYWKVLRREKKARKLYVAEERIPETETWWGRDEIQGISSKQWNGIREMPVHTKVMRKMRDILLEETQYAFLSDSAAERLFEMRELAKERLLGTETVIPITGHAAGIFPFLGAREMLTLCLALNNQGISARLHLDGSVPVCIFVRDCGAAEVRRILNAIQYEPFSLSAQMLPEDPETAGKFSPYIPKELQQKAFLADVLDAEGLQTHLQL